MKVNNVESEPKKWASPFDPEVKELPKHDLVQQDHVDNTIQEMLCNLTGKELPWNIGIISAIREVAQTEIYKHYGIQIPYAFIEDEKEDKGNNSNTDAPKVFVAFEQEFGRLLSPIEIEQISQWLDETETPLILEALKQAVLNGKFSFRYIDRILLNWHKNNVRTVRDAVERNSRHKEYIKEKEIDAAAEEKRKLLDSLYCN